MRYVFILILLAILLVGCIPMRPASKDNGIFQQYHIGQCYYVEPDNCDE